MSAESNQGLVRETFREIHPDFGDLMDRAIGTKDSGLIPLEVSLEVIEHRAKDVGVEVEEMWEDKPPGIFSRLFVINDRKGLGEVGKHVLLLEYEGSLWVHNGDFDDFKELMGLA